MLMSETMESAICSEAKRSYSWWLDSHITPKNSKWLLENLTNMDSKIKSMMKLIEEDADSFARRAEMYYKKRPELMKLVEEFYRAYRALAERYDRVTGALRQAHRTIAVAFPNQIQSILPDEPPSGLPDSVQEEKENFVIQSFSGGNGEYSDDNNPFMSKEEWKHLNHLLADEEDHYKFAEELLMKGLNFKEDDGKNSVVKKLQEDVSKLSIENKNLKNQISLESLRANEAETESQAFKDAVSKLKSQLEAAFVQYKASQERMSYLEAEISQRQDEAHHLKDEMSIKLTKLSIEEERCINLEKENSSLRFELSKFNDAASKQVEQVSDLLKENLNLHNTVKLELLRSERAETESFTLREAVSKLNSELGTSLLQYKVSQERISDLEAEIRRAENQLENLNGELSIRTSKLNIAEEQYLVLQEENKFLQSTVDRFKMMMEKKEEEVILREEELRKLKQFIEDELQRFKYAGIQESMSLHMELNKLKQRIGGQEEELDVREKELDKLKRSLEDERQWRMIAEVDNQSLKKLYSQSEEKVRVLGLEIQSGDESLRRMENIKIGLEEEINRLHDENNDLNEKSSSSLSNIVALQDEINSLRRSKLKIADELSFHLDQSKGLQQELSLLKTERNSSEERRHELMEQLVEVNLNVVSLRTLVQQLLDGKTELKDAHKEHEYPFNLEDLRLMESLSERNSLLESSLTDLTVELKWFREKIKGLEECCESLRGNAANHASESSEMAFHAEAIAKNIRKLSEKTKLFENSLSDATFEFEGLREKVKALEGSCNSLYYQNCYLIAENNNLVAQVKKIEQHMESLDNRFSTFEGKHLNMDNEKDLLKSAKEDHENHALFFKSQTSSLINQINILKEKNQLINEELEDGMHKTVKSGIDCFITKQILYDMNEKNLILSDECRKYMNKLRCAEDLSLELKHVQSTQEKKLVLLLEENKKLLEWVQALLKVFEAEEDNETSKGGYRNMLQFISHKLIDLRALVSDPGEEFLHIHLEKSPFIILLEQLGLSLVELRARKYVLELESEKENEEISLLHSGSYELMEVNEQLRKDLNACNQQREYLMIELEAMRLKLSDLQEAQSTFHGEISKSFAESECISSKSFELREQTVSQEEEHDAILEEFMIHENLSYNFRSSDAEKSSGIDQLINDVYNLHGITNDLGQDIRFLNENMRALQSENMHLRDLAADFEARNSALLEDDVHKVSEVFEERIMEWSDTHQRFQNMQLENTKLFVDLEGLMMELNKANVVREELEKKILLLSKENVHKDDENEFLRQSNEKFAGEISRLRKDAEALRRREKNLTSELQTAENRREDLMKQVDVLLKENKELEANFPLLLSLDDDIGSLAEHSVSLANDHILSSEREQGNIMSATHQQKRFSQVRGDDHVSEASAGIMELEKLHGKVKQLQKTVKNAEKLLAKEEILTETTLASQTRKIKTRRSKENKSPLQLETGKRKDIFDSRKSNAADKDVRLLKIEQDVSKVKHEHILKDIELEHVLSSFRSGDDFSCETEEQAHEMLEPQTNNVKEHHKIDIMAGERSVNPSSELVLEKEFSVDELELLESHHEWSRRIGETLSSDTLRLCILQENLQELKKNMEASDLSIQSSSSASNSITEQLKISALVIEQLIGINFKLTEMADNFSTSLDDKEGRRQVSERVQIASKKIDVVELELENIQCILSKLLEEEESKALKTLQRKSRFPLKGFMYWKRNDSRKKRRRFCACMRFNTISD